MGWLGMAVPGELRPLENMSIGREHFAVSECSKCPTTGIDAADRLIKRVYASNSLRATIVATYLNEMREAMREMVRVLKPGGHLVLVIGNNEVCGLPFRSSVFLTEICEGLGLRAKLRLIDEIKSRGLMTKRNKTASVITREWVILLEKPRHFRGKLSAAD
jgi:SAM-dependent methyltransferase